MITVELGTISSRGQIAIPSSIRKKMALQEGEKMLFFMQDDTLLLKKVTTETFSQLTKPFRKAAKNIKEEDVASLIHQMRTNAQNNS
jgi:AbrB family looped-hinge helix DNA binding protein